MNPRLLTIFALALASLYSASIGPRAAPEQGAEGRRTRGPAYRFHKVTDDVYSAVGTGTMSVGSNSAVIINDQEVLIVDSHITPASARALLEELKSITSKPVRYVVSTHYHFDHAHGNQIFPPEVQIIGHEFTRQMLLGNVLEQRTYRSFTSGLPAAIDALKKQAASETDPAARSKLETQIVVQQEYLEALKEITPTPPNVTLTAKMTLYRGGREIQLHFLGRGHTGGDVVVLLPKERIVCTGDLLAAGLAFMGDGFIEEWVATLDRLKALDFDTVVPGHGEVFTGKAKIDAFQRYLKDVWSQVSSLRKQGLGAEEAAKRVDTSAHKAAFPQIQGPGIDPRGVVRMYELMEERAR